MKMKSLATLLLALSASLAFAAEPVDYNQSIEFAQERTQSQTPKEKAIYCLGPEQLEEFYLVGDKEQKRIARRAMICNFDNIKNLGNALNQANLSQGENYEVFLYRADSKKPVVRILGDGGYLPGSQFVLQPGDLIIIQRPAAGKK